MRKPKADDFHTDNGLHTAMREYAEHKSMDGRLLISLTCEDGTVMREHVEREIAFISYKDRDGEVYEVPYRTDKFVDAVWGEGKALPPTDMLEAAAKWASSCGSEITGASAVLVDV